MWVHAEVNKFVEGDHHRVLRSSTPPHPLATAVRPTDPRSVYLMMCESWKAALYSLLYAEGRPTIGWRVPGSLLWSSSFLWSVDTSGRDPAAEEGSLGAAAEGHLRAAGILL